MEIEKLTEWNPWWENKDLIKNFEGHKREAYSDLVKSIEIKEITILTGIRRCGKSTLMYQMISNLFKKGVEPSQVLFINLEDNKIASDSLEEIYRTYREKINPEKKAYIFLDEIHKKKGWEAWIRKKYDLKTDDKFVISGSCSYLLKKEYSTLLTGRNLTFEVFPLSFYEFLAFNKIGIDPKKIKKGIILEKTEIKLINMLKEYFRIGGFPEIYFKEPEFRLRILEQYFDDILYKDIIDRYNLNTQKAKDFALYLMANFTGQISLRNIRNSLGISYDTIKDYLSYFKDAFLFFTIDNFSYSFKEQKTLPSKIYCIDNGLRNAVSFNFSKDTGKLAENAVFINLKTKHKEIYYWNEKSEVDFIIKNKDQSLTAINITYTDEINNREIKGLKEFNAKFKNVKELILLTKNTQKNKEGIKYIPLWKWLLL